MSGGSFYGGPNNNLEHQVLTKGQEALKDALNGKITPGELRAINAEITDFAGFQRNLVNVTGAPVAAVGLAAAAPEAAIAAALGISVEAATGFVALGGGALGGLTGVSLDPASLLGIGNE